MGAPVTVLTIGGTTESRAGDTRTHVTGLLAAVTSRLPADRFTPRWVGYPSDYGIRHAFRDSVRIGADNAAQVAATIGGPVILLGYSQGATVARELLDRHAHGIGPRLDIVAAGLVADPQMPAGAAHGKAGLVGYGVAGPGGKVTVPAWWIANDRDPIPAAAPGSLLRTAADLTEYMAVTDMAQWGSRVLARIRARNWQNGWGAAQPVTLAGIRAAKRRADSAAAEVMAYLPPVPVVNPAGGQHSSYAVAPYAPGDSATGCEVMARILAAQTAN